MKKCGSLASNFKLTHKTVEAHRELNKTRHNIEQKSRLTFSFKESMNEGELVSLNNNHVFLVNALKNSHHILGPDYGNLRTKRRKKKMVEKLISTL